jgi:hypothetical protein
MISYTLMNALVYGADYIKYAIAKKNGKENAEKPVWNVSIVALVVTALFLVYFFVPVA